MSKRGILNYDDDKDREYILSNKISLITQDQALPVSKYKQTIKEYDIIINNRCRTLYADGYAMEDLLRRWKSKRSWTKIAISQRHVMHYVDAYHVNPFEILLDYDKSRGWHFSYQETRSHWFRVDISICTQDAKRIQKIHDEMEWRNRLNISYDDELTEEQQMQKKLQIGI